MNIIVEKDEFRKSYGDDIESTGISIIEGIEKWKISAMQIVDHKKI